jgi:hypothetical protein
MRNQFIAGSANPPPPPRLWPAVPYKSRVVGRTTVRKAWRCHQPTREIDREELPGHCWGDWESIALQAGSLRQPSAAAPTPLVVRTVGFAHVMNCHHPSESGIRAGAVVPHAAIGRTHGGAVPVTVVCWDHIARGEALPSDFAYSIRFLFINRSVLAVLLLQG